MHFVTKFRSDSGKEGVGAGQRMAQAESCYELSAPPPERMTGSTKEVIRPLM